MRNFLVAKDLTGVIRACVRASGQSEGLQVSVLSVPPQTQLMRKECLDNVSENGLL